MRNMLTLMLIVGSFATQARDTETNKIIYQSIKDFKIAAKENDHSKCFIDVFRDGFRPIFNEEFDSPKIAETLCIGDLVSYKNTENKIIEGIIVNLEPNGSLVNMAPISGKATKQDGYNGAGYRDYPENFWFLSRSSHEKKSFSVNVKDHMHGDYTEEYTLSNEGFYQLDTVKSDGTQYSVILD